jgi:chromosomal replication initiator protein
MYQHQKETKQLREKMRKEKKCANELTKDMEFTIIKITPEQKVKMLANSKQILNQACKYFQVTEEVLKSPSRKRNLVEVRMITIHQIRMIVKLPYSNIGNMFGGRDHTTVIHSLKATEDLLETNYPFRIKYQSFKESLTKEDEI